MMLADTSAHDRIVGEFAAARLLPAEAALVRMAELFPSLPPDVEVNRVQTAELTGEWVIAGRAPVEGVMLYLHGGGYTEGSCRTHRELVARIARVAGCEAYSVEYRLAHQAPFPAAVDDAIAAYRWLRVARPGKRIAIVGDSAGGGLALSLLFSLGELGEPYPEVAALISPWCDLTLSTTTATDDPLLDADDLRARGRLYAGADNLRDPRASPVYGDFSGLPPLFVQVGERDLLRNDAVRVAELAEAAGIPVDLEIWPGMTHVWHALGDSVPQAQAAVARLGTALRAHLRPRVAAHLPPRMTAPET